jgi:excisionase family DNA binding protein
MDNRIKGKLTVGQVARKLGVTRQMIDEWMRQGRIKHTWIGLQRFVAPQDAVKPEPIKPGPKT